MAVNEDTIPRELRAKAPPLLLMFVKQRVYWTIFGLGLAVFLLYGPISGPNAPDHNGLRYLLAPWICPWGAAIYYMFVPFNPYSSGSVSRFAGMIDYNKRDSDANRLVEVFRSPATRHALIRVTLRISVILFLIMMLITIIIRHSLTWSFSSYWLGEGLLGGTVGASIAVGSEYVNSGVRFWAAHYRGTNNNERSA